MKKTILVLIAVVFMSLNSYGQDKETQLAPREKMQEVTVLGTVTEINKETREITMMNKDGGLMTVTAGEEVVRFDEIAIDDVLEFDFITYMKAEFREPTAEEIAEPIQMIAEAGKAPENLDPAGVVGAVVKAVVSIEVLNRPNMVATVKGPQGNYVSIPMEDEKLMTELRIGQVFILTYAEAIAISLQKVGASE